MKRKGIALIVQLIEKTYATGISVKPKELEPFLSYWFQDDKLPKWEVKIVLGF
jgi:hypothetical protein